MVSPIRPFKCPFMSVVKQGGKHRFTDLMRMCCWDRDRSQTKLFFSWYVCLKNVIFVSECSECVSMCVCEKWVQCVSGWWWGERIGHNLWSFSFLPQEWMDSGLLPVSLRGGAVARPMWHWFRKWMVSERSRFLLTVSVNTTTALEQLLCKNDNVLPMYCSIKYCR